MKNKKVVYTSLSKGYDELQQPEMIHPDYDYICFSNDLEQKNIGIWKIEKIPFSSDSNVRLTRFPKLNPQIVLPDYEFSLWVDANLSLSEQIMQRAEELVAKDTLIAMVPHSERESVYQEARCLTRRLIDSPFIIYDQTRFLIDEGFPQDFPLYVCCCMFRKHNEKSCMDFCTLWWKTYCRYSFRDQMSVSYSLWKTGIVPELFWTNDFYYKFVHPHKTIKKNALPKRFFRFVYSHILLFRLRLLYLKNHISWKDWT